MELIYFGEHGPLLATPMVVV